MEMVEKVARALREGGSYEDMARAAMATMREPTAEMLAAAVASWDGSKSLSLAVNSIWSGMIDAALTEASPSRPEATE